ncbi:MAG: alpha-hydroxy acid oxidase [bacterium]|nr:alpha-hydroxy acid oxidase [bacterium]MDE0415922.1 alpha-hydroxy acid oxidase [bacterium]
MTLDRRFPSIHVMQERAARRVPRFALGYLEGGIDREVCLEANIDALRRVVLTPRAIVDEAFEPDPSVTLFGRTWSLPFAPGPMGLTGLIWPNAPALIARAATGHDLPACLSSFATMSVEEIGAIAGSNLWFQLYCTVDPAIENDIVDRAEAAGASVLIVTVDVPTRTRRERDIASGLSVPPRFDRTTLTDIIARPAWALAMLRAGIPQLRTLERYMPKGLPLSAMGEHLASMTDGRVTAGKLERLRERWKGAMIVKGLLNPDDAVRVRDMGIDAVAVSNHGGRQFDAAPAPVEVLPAIRRAVGAGYPLLADGGVRSGIDVARMIACGADFVLMGRAFAYAVAAGGEAGVDHAINIIRADLRQAMVQAGTPGLRDLSACRVAAERRSA